AHIMVTTAPDPQSKNSGKAGSEAEARKKIDTVLTRLQAGEEFSALAMTFSEDSATSANGGDIGNVPGSALKQNDATTGEDVMNLKPGQYTPVLSVTNPSNRQLVGFQIVKLISAESAGLREVSDQRVQQEIRQQIQDRREQLLKTAYFEVMRNQAKIE